MRDPISTIGNGNSTWVRFAIGIAFAGATTAIGFVVNDHTKINVVSSQQDKDESMAQRYREETRDEMRYRFDHLEERLNKIQDELSELTIRGQQPQASSHKKQNPG